MPFYTSLTNAGTIWAEVSYEGISGQGRISPSVVVLVGIKTPAPQVEVELHHLLATLTCASERLARSELAPSKLYSHDTTFQVPFPIGPRALSYISDAMGSDDFAFKLELDGLIRARQTGDTGSFVRPDRPLGEWGFEHVGPTDLHFTVPRSEWFTKVVTPISDARFITVEIEVPDGPRRGDLKASLDLLSEAERCYAIGDDAGVFHRCRGAIEALPGYPKRVVDRIENDQKREQANRLYFEAGQFLHAGRHVSQSGRDAGTFPVDHRDASLALNLTRLLVGYLSRL